MLTTRHLRSSFLTLAIAASAAIAAPLGAQAATGTGADFGPDAPVTSVFFTQVERGIRNDVRWNPVTDQFRAYTRTKVDPGFEYGIVEEHAGLGVLAGGRGTAGKLPIILKGYNTIEPDGAMGATFDFLDFSSALLARARGGEQVFTPATASGGKALLVATTRLSSNECGGLKTGVRTTWLDAATLVPFRVLDKRGGKVDRDVRFTTRVGTANEFPKITYTGKRFVTYNGFLQGTAQQPKVKLPFAVSLPTALPTGFTLHHTGSAKAGANLGPEASFPRSKGLFGAQFRRGTEVLDFTIRGAAGTLKADWDLSDPWGVECGINTVEKVQVGAFAGHFSDGEQGNARIWWRNGATLYSLAGPFPKQQLAAIGASLQPVA